MAPSVSQVSPARRDPIAPPHNTNTKHKRQQPLLSAIPSSLLLFAECGRGRARAALVNDISELDQQQRYLIKKPACSKPTLKTPGTQDRRHSVAARGNGSVRLWPSLGGKSGQNETVVCTALTTAQPRGADVAGNRLPSLSSSVVTRIFCVMKKSWPPGRGRSASRGPQTDRSPPCDNDSDTSSHNSRDNDSDTSSHNDGYQQGGSSPGHQPQRQKRMRTSFKHHQLRAMKSYFALNHNPDAKDLKQLAQKTGLTKRVLQVWFQNARAKYRRNLLRQQSDSQSSQNAQKDPSITELPASTPALGNVVSPTSRSSNNNNGGQPKHASSNMPDMSPTAHAPSVSMECHVSLASSMTSSDGHMQPLTHLDMAHAHSPSLSTLSPPNSAGLSTHAQSFLQEIGRELPQTTM
ncbi:LIM/homeobox protein Lhx2 [Branchiostoma belcheri]|nr:LIM/homeobox protein Lhx2 [Branchiostoma belcheri]